MISVLILARDEEQDLPGCLESVRWSDDVHVYDSGSTDATAEIAARAGARFVQRSADLGQQIFGGNEAEHKNWAMANLPFKHKWVLHLDSDERVTPELAANIRRAVQNSGDKVAFRIQRRDFWGERWLKHVQASSYYMRLFRPEKIRYERLVNPVSIADGPVGELDGYLDHYPFSKGMSHWLNRHNFYSSLEAQQILRNRATNQQFSPVQAFLARDRNQRRFHQKELFYRMPARPLLKFFILYLGKCGFLDGRAGFNYAMLQSFYESMIVLKTKELTGKSAASDMGKEARSENPSKASRSGGVLEGPHAHSSSNN
jgi:glycosyltransferase involved in cell wall biosynthesis